jgi:predicted NBD/HSP70 family sugar kinase
VIGQCGSGFWILEPDEVFEMAAQGDLRCAAFVRLWHRALAAATATSIHLEGPVDSSSPAVMHDLFR